MVCKQLREKAEAKKLEDDFSPNQDLVQALGKPPEEPSIQDHEELPTVSRWRGGRLGTLLIFIFHSYLLENIYFKMWPGC